MTSKAALCLALLEGRVLNIKNGFELFGITNIPREIGRSVERAFDVQVSRTTMVGKSRYGQECTWCNYRLNRTEYNKQGIEKMREYIRQQLPSSTEAKTDTQKRKLQQQELFLGI